jgi:AraC-like DNA-binding protein
MRILGSYAVVYLKAGEGWFEDDRGWRQAVAAGDLITLFPDIGHRYGPQQGQPWSEFYLVFSGGVFDLWRDCGLLNPAHPVVRLVPVEYWSRRLESVVEKSRVPVPGSSLLEACRLQTVLAEAVATGLNPTGKAEEPAWLALACEALEEDLDRAVDLPGLARRLHMSYDTFRRRFARAVGMPPARFRTHRIIERACLLMQQGKLTDKQVASRLGFCDAFHFSRRFRQVTGMSPRLYRRRFPWPG